MYTVDTHAHLEEIANLEPDLAAAKAAGVAAIIAVGSDASSNQKILGIARAHPGLVYPALGLHPWNLKEAGLSGDLESIEANLNEAVAVGEVGLDYHKKVREGADKDFQKRALREILRLARTHQKPVLIHSRYAWRDALDLVVEANIELAVFHWYTGTSSVLRDIIGHGYFISAGPAVEYHEEHRRAVKECPLERLLLETDSPVVYQRGTPSEYESRPADVVRVLKGAAQLKGVDEAALAGVTTRNALSLFHIKAALY
ncbi:MAG: TatD family hydrolase [Dehalococcoidales bacterium]|nr:TatD family hydrolase [Dehalococcoidales bacterium]